MLGRTKMQVNAPRSCCFFSCNAGILPALCISRCSSHCACHPESSRGTSLRFVRAMFTRWLCSSIRAYFRKAPEARQKLAQSVRTGKARKEITSAVGATPTRRQISDRIPHCASLIERGIPFRSSFSCDGIPDFGCIGQPQECWKRLR